MKSKEQSNPDQNYTICENCHQEILSSKMFLHEGFCLRNNTYCSLCDKVILKTDYENHVKAFHYSLQNPNNFSYNQEFLEKNENNLQQFPENIQNPQNKHPILINQINYNSCVNMDFRSVKKLEIIKYNKPIVITTNGNSPLKNPEEYKEFFLKNYFMNNSLDKNEVNNIKTESNLINNLSDTNFYKQRTTETQYLNKAVKNFQYIPNSPNDQYYTNLNNFPKNKILKLPKNHYLQSSFSVDNIKQNKNINEIKRSGNIFTLSDLNIKNKNIQNNDKSYQSPKKIDHQTIIQPYYAKNNKKINQNIFYTPITFNPKKQTTNETKLYEFNNYIIRKIPNKFQKNQNKPIINFYKNNNISEKKNNNNKEPLDRESRMTKYKPKFEKCEYCGRVVEDLTAHFYRCQSRRMIEINRIQSRQEEEKMFREKRNSLKEKSNFNLVSNQSAQDFYRANNVRFKSLMPLSPQNLEKNNNISGIKSEPNELKNQFNYPENNYNSNNSNKFGDNNLNKSQEKKDVFKEMKKNNIINIPYEKQSYVRASKTPLRNGENANINYIYGI